jgi:hypothetical protein
LRPNEFERAFSVNREVESVADYQCRDQENERDREH